MSKTNERGTLVLPAGDVEFAWFRCGAPRTLDLTLIMLHEGLGCVDMWGTFPADLAVRTGADVLAYSRYGYGRSAALPAHRDSDFMHLEAWDVLPGVLHAAGVDGRFALVGHSDGGSIAAIYAGSPMVRDAALAGVVFMAAHVFNEPLCIEGIRAAARAYEQCAPDQGLRKGLARFHRARTGQVFSAWRDIWLDGAFAHWNIEAYLAAIDRPVLILQGLDDPYGSVAQVNAMANGVRGHVHTALIPHCGHSPHRDQSEAALIAVEQFVQSIN